MDKQKKQIVALIVLAVAALGAGSYFIFIRDSGENAASRHTRTGPVERRVRESSSVDKSAKKKRSRPKKRREARVTAGPEKRERKGPATKTAAKRKRSKSGGKKVKKQEQKPAA